MCASCHKASVFLGTPKTCSACHDGNMVILGLNRSAAHIPTGVVECSNCHNTTDFTSNWFMTHSAVNAIACSTCHNGSYVTKYNAMAKPANHVVTTAECNTCHTTVPAPGSSFTIDAWNSADVDGTVHVGLTTTSNCVGCHNNVIAKGKAAYPAHPVSASDQCGTCHSWTFSVGFKCASAYESLQNFAYMVLDKTKSFFNTMMA